MSKTTTKTILSAKGARKVTALTAYDAIFAKLADQAGADIILVGDSVGTTFMGYNSTVPVTMADMIHHTSMVARANPSAMVVADLPFASAHMKFDSLLKSCASLLRAGADAVKIEGGKSVAKKIARLVEAGVPVMGHIGLMPQQFLKLGSYRTFGKSEAEKQSVMDDAKALDDAGVFAMVLEKTEKQLAVEITGKVGAITIGIGSGGGCDGQVLVCSDVLGLGEFIPPFAKCYADLRSEVAKAFGEYVNEVKSGKFSS
jgi:3-methyl-2-oxobutanoate hydroxymethyltransferase